MRKILPILLIAILLLTGCGQKADGEGTQNAAAYTKIDQETAKEMMAKDDGHVIVDVRRQDEYDAGHIPGAILIPNESIGCDSPEALPDYNQIILIYCRTGNRSKQAAEKLAAMGYTNIYEFGGIVDWTGEIVTSEDDGDEDGKCIYGPAMEQQTFTPYPVRITIPDLNYRHGPNTSYPSWGYIPVGVYTIVDEQDGWGLLKAYAQNRNGWIKLSYAQKL